jgi:hypothetical protein
MEGAKGLGEHDKKNKSFLIGGEMKEASVAVMIHSKWIDKEIKLMAWMTRL